MKIVILLLSLSLIFPARTNAQVKINEISSYPSSADWVELYSDIEIDISGWLLKDSISEIKTIPSGTKIGTPSASFYMVTVSNRLNRDEDLVELFKADKTTLVDSVSYGFSDAICAPGENQTLGRKPDGGNWTRLASATQASPNTSEEFPCPSPSPSPTPTPTPASPTPSPSPAPSPSPSPTPSPSPRPSPKPSPSILARESPTGTVAGETFIDLSAFGNSPSPSPSLTPDHDRLSLNRDRARIVVLIGSGLLLISLAAGFGLRRYRHSQSHAL